MIVVAMLLIGAIVLTFLWLELAAILIHGRRRRVF